MSANEPQPYSMLYRNTTGGQHVVAAVGHAFGRSRSITSRWRVLFTPRTSLTTMIVVTLGPLARGLRPKVAHVFRSAKKKSHGCM